MNGNTPQYTGPRIGTKQQAEAPPSGGRVLVPPGFAGTADRATERSLQVNIDSAEDAKSVIQNLPAIKARWDELQTEGVNSVEFAIAEDVVKETELTLRGAINWCRTYIKHVKPFPGNILFPLPSYKDLTVRPIQQSSSAERNTAQTRVKPPRPVSAEPATT